MAPKKSGRRRALTDTERDRIISLARAGRARNDIARDVGRSAGIVTKIVHAAGLTFDRTATRAATDARRDDLAARRAELLAGIYDDALRLRSQMFAPTVAFNFGGRDNSYNEVALDEPTFADKRHIATSVAALANAAGRIEERDTNAGDTAAIDDWLAAWKAP